MVFDREKFPILYYKCILELSEPDIFLHLNAFQKFIKAIGNRFLLKKNTQQIVIPNYEITILLTAPEMTLNVLKGRKTPTQPTNQLTVY